MNNAAISASDLASKHCQPCAKGAPALESERAKQLLATLPGWSSDVRSISKTFAFENYHQTIAFVNASAWVSHREDHHPDLEVGYNKCVVRYSTHSVNGLSENDFICAARLEALTAM